LEKDLLEKYGRPSAEALVESALNEARILEDEDFFDIKMSVKHSSPRIMIEAYRMLADKVDYPLHLGVTEAGTPGVGTIKSAVGLGALLAAASLPPLSTALRGGPARTPSHRPALPLRLTALVPGELSRLLALLAREGLRAERLAAVLRSRRVVARTRSPVAATAASSPSTPTPATAAVLLSELRRHRALLALVHRTGTGIARRLCRRRGLASALGLVLGAL
jgi:hypothetical protein